MSKMGDFQFGDLKRFKQSLEQMQLDYHAFVEECIKELANRLLAKTIARTPVGETGDLRKGWTLGPVQRTGSEFHVEILNPVEYSKYVEYGHRTANHTGWVEGRFMLTISQEELEREMPVILERKLQQYIERRLR